MVQIKMVKLQKSKTSNLFFIFCFLSIHALSIPHAIAGTQCLAEVARAVSIQGNVELRRAHDSVWKAVKLDTKICINDTLRVRKNSRAALRLSNNSMMRLDQKTTVTFPAIEEKDSSSLIDVLKGAIHILTRTPQPFKIRTPFMNAGVEGTEFFVGVEADHTRLIVYEGQVSASNDQGSVTLNAQESTVAYKNQLPHKDIIIRSIDAVQWALYYPAIIGNHRHTTPKETNVSDLLYEAENLLSVGQAHEANLLINRLLESEADNSDAIALQAIIAVVQNDKELAFEKATRAVSLHDQSVPAKLALSYAQQASFKIEDALLSVKQAVELDPYNALIWARLAELYMSIGELENALDAANEAVRLDASIAKTQTVLGFSHLLQINITDAKAIFEKAILLDQSDPMPRLGMGLALIREGELETGRIEIEIAASLDPANSLVRSYLGKAYFEEERGLSRNSLRAEARIV